MGQDLAFHGRQGKCRNAAVKLLRELGDDKELARLAEEDERRRQWREDAKARRAAERKQIREAIAEQVFNEQEALAEGVMG